MFIAERQTIMAHIKIVKTKKKFEKPSLIVGFEEAQINHTLFEILVVKLSLCDIFLRKKTWV